MSVVIDLTVDNVNECVVVSPVIIDLVSDVECEFDSIDSPVFSGTAMDCTSLRNPVRPYHLYSDDDFTDEDPVNEDEFFFSECYSDPNPELFVGVLSSIPHPVPVNVEEKSILGRRKRDSHFNWKRATPLEMSVRLSQNRVRDYYSVPSFLRLSHPKFSPEKFKLLCDFYETEQLVMALKTELIEKKADIFYGSDRQHNVNLSEWALDMKIVTGAHGSYLEISGFKPGCPYRLIDQPGHHTKYKESFIYSFYRVEGGFIYHQKQPVSYACYIPGRYYFNMRDLNLVLRC